MREEWSVLEEGSGNHVRLPEDALYQQSLHNGSRWQRRMYMWNGRGLGLFAPTMKDDFHILERIGSGANTDKICARGSPATLEAWPHVIGFRPDDSIMQYGFTMRTKRTWYITSECS
jgi:hypothetical protein